MSSSIIQKKAIENQKKINKQLEERERRKKERRENVKRRQNNTLESIIIDEINIETDIHQYKKETIDLNLKNENLKRKQKTLIAEYNKKITEYSVKEEKLINNIFNLEKQKLGLQNQTNEFTLELQHIKSDIKCCEIKNDEYQKKNTIQLNKINETEQMYEENFLYLKKKKEKLQNDIEYFEEDYNNIKNNKVLLINKINKLNNDLNQLNENIENKEQIYKDLHKVVENNYIETVNGLEEQYKVRIKLKNEELQVTENTLITEIIKMSSNLEIKKNEYNNNIIELEKSFEERFSKLKTEQSSKINNLKICHLKQENELENNFLRLKREFESNEDQLRSNVNQKRLRRKKKMNDIINNNSKGNQTNIIKVNEIEVQAGNPFSYINTRETQCNLIKDFEKDVIMQHQLINNRNILLNNEEYSKSLSLTPILDLIEDTVIEKIQVEDNFENTIDVFRELYLDELQKSNYNSNEKTHILEKLYKLKEKSFPTTKINNKFIPQLAPKKVIKKETTIEQLEYEELGIGIIDYFNNELNKIIKTIDEGKIRMKKNQIAYITSNFIEINSKFYYSFHFKFYDNYSNTFNIFYNFDKNRTNLLHINLFTNEGGVKKMIDLKIEKEYKIIIKNENNTLVISFNDIEVYKNDFPYTFKYIESNTNYYIKNFL